MRGNAGSWGSRDRNKVYRELEHPADLLLEICGTDLPTLFENALFALYDQVAVLAGFRAREDLTLNVHGASAADALRALLAEALYHFDAGAFVAVGAEVSLEASNPEEVRATAVLHGEQADKRRHTLLAEVKAVTYHQLSVARAEGTGWRATVLFDV